MTCGPGIWRKRQNCGSIHFNQGATSFRLLAWGSSVNTLKAQKDKVRKSASEAKAATISYRYHVAEGPTAGMAIELGVEHDDSLQQKNMAEGNSRCPATEISIDNCVDSCDTSCKRLS